MSEKEAKRISRAKLQADALRLAQLEEENTDLRREVLALRKRNVQMASFIEEKKYITKKTSKPSRLTVGSKYPGTSQATPLEKCIQSKIGEGMSHEDAKEWCENELSEYPGKIKTPEDKTWAERGREQ